MRYASAYLRKGQFFLSPFSKTTTGLLVAWDPLGVSSQEDPELGKKVLWVLLQSTAEVPHPETLGIRSRAMAKAAGARSYEAFADLAKCVAIAQDDSDEVIFTPTRNGGRGERFLHLKTKIRCRPVEPEVTQALMQAFDACE
jgi:hypothetical protein